MFFVTDIFYWLNKYKISISKHVMQLHQYSSAMSWLSYLLYTSTVMHRYRLPTFVSTLRGFVYSLIILAYFRNIKEIYVLFTWPGSSSYLRMTSENEICSDPVQKEALEK